jgi:hypothetical protein
VQLTTLAGNPSKIALESINVLRVTDSAQARVHVFKIKDLAALQ